MLSLRLAAAALLFAAMGGPAVAADRGDPDACALVASGDVPPLLVAGDVELRSHNGHPQPGQSTCEWDAFRKGLTADAPPDGRLSLTYYHFANAAAAGAQMLRLAKGGIVPGLVRTADAQDQVVRPDGTTVVARHGQDVAVVNAGDVQYEAPARADWSYRLQALALTASGARVLGPIDDRAVADVCHLVPSAHILALLTLQPSHLEAAPGRQSCRFDVRDDTGIVDAWVTNDGDINIERRDLGNRAAALDFQHDQTPFLPASHLVATADPLDRLVANSEHPEEVWAVHGPYYVSLSVSGATAAARAHPTWLYRVQRAALEAAGASIREPANASPDPVVPAHAEKTPDAAASWVPPAHAAPAWSALFDIVLHVVDFFASYRFFMLPACIFLPVLFANMRGAPVRSAGRGSRILPNWIIVPAGVFLGVANLVLGTQVSTILIYRFGASGSATVTAEHGTSTQYNNHDVLAYDVLIRTADGQVITTGFEDDDFNVYPPHNATSYPGPGDVFTVRYLAHFPRDFIIVANDASPWATRLRCSALLSGVYDAGQKQGFAPDIPAYHHAYDDAVRAAREAGCGAGIPG